MGYLFSGFCIFMMILVLTSYSSAETAEIGSKNVPGGNISSSNLEADRETTDWAGFYGTFRDAVGMEEGDEIFYSWDVSYVDANILATETGNEFSGDESNLNTVTSSTEADDIPGIPDKGMETASNTYNDSILRKPDVGSLGKTVNTNVSYGQSSASFTNFLYEYDDGSNQHPVYSTGTFRDEKAFNGVNSINYQLLVGADGSDGSTSTSFNFYLELE